MVRQLSINFDNDTIEENDNKDTYYDEKMYHLIIK